MTESKTTATLPTLNINDHLPENFSPESKVWIYQASRLFTISEALELEKDLKHFTHNWKSHSRAVKGYANLFFGQFIIIMADDIRDRICGRSINQSVEFMKETEKKYGITLFDRMALAFWLKNKVEILPMPQLGYAIENNFLTPETPFFNNTVSSRAELEQNWIKPAGETWLKSYFSKA